MSFETSPDVNNFTKLKEQIDNCMRKAMDDLLIDAMSAKMDESQIDWIIRLLRETIERLNQLTPRRKDLHSELNGKIDLDLIRQMMSHEAVEENDVCFLIDTIFERLQMLCSPSQDKQIASEKEECKSMDTISKKMCFLLSKTNKNIDDIQNLLKRLNGI